MAITVTDLGGITGSSGATLVLTGVTAAAGDLVCVITEENVNTTVEQTMTDSAGNTYVNTTPLLHPNSSTTNGIGTIFWSVLTSALSAGSITYTRIIGSGTSVAMAALGAHSPTGWTASPLDSGFTNTATGSSTTPSVTSSAAPSKPGEFLVGGVVARTAQASFTQDTGNGWASPFQRQSITNAVVLGGNQTTNQTSSTVTYAPTLPTSSVWAAIVIAFTPIPPLPGSNASVYQAIKRASYW